MLSASLWFAVLLLSLWWWWTRRTSSNPLCNAAYRAILGAVEGNRQPAPCGGGGGPPSRRTRSSGACKGEKLVSDRSRLNRDLERVRHFARALRSLPLRDGRAIRRVAWNCDLELPGHVAWEPHRSGSSLLEHCELLPRLHSATDDDAPVPLHRSYADQRPLRLRGGSYAMWQMADPGTVTLPHVDDDLHGVTMGTYFWMVEGAQLMVAWRRCDLHEDEVLRDVARAAHPSLSRLESVPSLTLLRAEAGDVIHIPKDAVHMVVSETRKVQLAYHVYEG
jgi:hypothetical protein